MRSRFDPADVGRRYDEAAAGYEERHECDARGRRRAQVIDGVLLRACRGARRVLEIGCGTCRLLAKVDAAERVGVDVSQGMLARAPRHLWCLRADGQRLPFAADTFDAVIAGKGSFRYLAPDRGFSECARVLRRGGRLAVHLFAARTWALRDLVAAPPAAGPDVRSLASVRLAASRAGLACEGVTVWRSIRVYPHLLRIPVRLPGRWWSHTVMVFAPR